MLLTEIAERLNKTVEEVNYLAFKHNIVVYHDNANGEYLNCTDSEKLLKLETETPTRYTKHGRECKDIIKDMLGSKGLQNFYLGNVIKYLYRNNSIGDIEKAKTYLEMYLDEVKEND